MYIYETMVHQFKDYNFFTRLFRRLGPNVKNSLTTAVVSFVHVFYGFLPELK